MPFAGVVLAASFALTGPALNPGTTQPEERHVAPPRYRGLGLNISAGAVGVAWLGLKVRTTLTLRRLSREADAGTLDNEECGRRCNDDSLFNEAIGAPLLLSSLGLLGGGMTLCGRHRGFAAGPDATALRTARIMVGVGGGLLSLGVTSWAVSRLASARAGSQSQATHVDMIDGGWYATAAFGYAGSAMLGYGLGYIQGQARANALSMQPSVGRRFMGLTLSGRL